MHIHTGTLLNPVRAQAGSAASPAPLPTDLISALLLVVTGGRVSDKRAGMGAGSLWVGGRERRVSENGRKLLNPSLKSTQQKQLQHRSYHADFNVATTIPTTWSHPPSPPSCPLHPRPQPGWCLLWSLVQCNVVPRPSSPLSTPALLGCISQAVCLHSALHCR